MKILSNIKNDKKQQNYRWDRCKTNKEKKTVDVFFLANWRSKIELGETISSESTKWWLYRTTSTETIRTCGKTKIQLFFFISNDRFVSFTKIFSEKLEWITNTPRVDDQNEKLIEEIKAHPNPKITNQLPRWKSQPKIETFNENYGRDDEPHLRPVVNPFLFLFSLLLIDAFRLLMKNFIGQVDQRSIPVSNWLNQLNDRFSSLLSRISKPNEYRGGVRPWKFRWCSCVCVWPLNEIKNERTNELI